MHHVQLTAGIARLVAKKHRNGTIGKFLDLSNTDGVGEVSMVGGTITDGTICKIGRVGKDGTFDGFLRSAIRTQH